jgi:hypothetical protein
MANIRCKLCGEHTFRPGGSDDRCDDCRRRSDIAEEVRRLGPVAERVFTFIRSEGGLGVWEDDIPQADRKWLKELEKVDAVERHGVLWRATV